MFHLRLLTTTFAAVVLWISTSHAGQINFNIGIDLQSTGQVYSITDDGTATGNPGAVWLAEIAISPIVLSQSDAITLTLKFSAGQQIKLADNGGGFSLGGNEHVAIAFLRQNTGNQVNGSSDIAIEFTDLIGAVAAPIAGTTFFSGAGVVGLQRVDFIPAGDEIAFGGLNVTFTLPSLTQTTSPLDILQVVLGAETVEIISPSPVSEPAGLALLTCALVGLYGRTRQRVRF